MSVNKCQPLHRRIDVQFSLSRWSLIPVSAEDQWFFDRRQTVWNLDLSDENENTTHTSDPPRLHFVMFGLNSHYACTFYRVDEMQVRYKELIHYWWNGVQCKNIYCYRAAIQITDGNMEQISADWTAHGSPEASGCRSSSSSYYPSSLELFAMFCLLLASRTTWPSSPIIAAVVAHQANVCFTGACWALRQWE